MDASTITPTNIPTNIPDLVDGQEWVCVEYITNNEVKVSPWFDNQYDMIDWFHESGATIQKKYIRNHNGIFEDNGLGDYFPLEDVDISECYTSSGYTSREDGCQPDAA